MSNILTKATALVQGDRQDDYGHPLDNHHRTAELWSFWLGSKVTPEDVCIMNILQKVARFKHLITEDGLVDIAGYAANIGMMWDESERRFLETFPSDEPKDTVMPEGPEGPDCPCAWCQSVYPR